jgi:regulatory protein
MQIARLKTSTRDPRVCRVEVSGVGAFQLDCESAAAMGIYDGAPVSEAQVEALVVASARRAATAHAMRLLQRRPRSRADIAQALRRKGVDAHLTATVVADLQRTGWIDDVQFARLWVRDRLALRPSGRKRLRFELLAHGVSPALADDTLARALPADREGEVALAQARRRVARLAGLPREVAVRRLAGWLQRRGFSGEIVARVMRAVWSPRSETDA